MRRAECSGHRNRSRVQNTRGRRIVLVRSVFRPGARICARTRRGCLTEVAKDPIGQSRLSELETDRHGLPAHCAFKPSQIVIFVGGRLDASQPHGHAASRTRWPVRIGGSELVRLYRTHAFLLPFGSRSSTGPSASDALRYGPLLENAARGNFVPVMVEWDRPISGGSWRKVE